MRGRGRQLGLALTLNLLPDGVGPRSQDVAATDVIIFHHLRLRDHLQQHTAAQGHREVLTTATIHHILCVHYYMVYGVPA